MQHRPPGLKVVTLTPGCGYGDERRDHRAEQPDVVADAQPGREVAQAPSLGVSVEPVGRRATGHQQLGAGEPGKGGDDVVDALTGDEPADDHDPVATAPRRRGRAGRAERRRVDPARHDRDAVGVRITSLPATPEKMLIAIREKERSDAMQAAE